MLSTDILKFDITSLPEFTRGKELASVLDIDTVTLFRYQRLARLLVEDYKACHIERLPLNRYQCWVLIQIRDAFQIFRCKKTITRTLREHPQKLSRFAFRKQTGIK
jgi:hypothetical protein